MTALPEGGVAAPKPPLWQRIAADITPLRESADYRRWWGGYMVSNVGSQLTIVAAQLQVFHLTHSSFAVGLTGLVTVVPLIIFGLIGGSIADAVDRRRLMLITSTILTLLSALLTVQAALHVDRVWLIYVLVGAQAGVFSIDSSARGAMLPRLIRRELIPAANALGQISQNTALTSGPLLAGFIVGAFGFAYAYGIDAVSFLAILYALFRLPAVPPEERRRPAPGLKSVAEGLAVSQAAQEPADDLPGRHQRHGVRHAEGAVPRACGRHVQRRCRHRGPALRRALGRRADRRRPVGLVRPGAPAGPRRAGRGRGVGGIDRGLRIRERAVVRPGDARDRGCGRHGQRDLPQHDPAGRDAGLVAGSVAGGVHRGRRWWSALRRRRVRHGRRA